MAMNKIKIKPGYHWECKYCDSTSAVQSPYEEKGFLVCGHCGAEWEDCKIQVKDEPFYE
ncbi:hypothetical protein SAMN02745217_02587 [Anaerocolumna xylanovorans DSM 12503]|uniref:Uncharacterized protein n=1 Tax=Anaerocolumna xylanovorans DSM 12503 TaxID=1121345 RepID=A0A1M7YBT4_9FIRM|nr:hypothetical protein SAMN02745217_02587 [Anaerocolumna xylanovorans DSM 12503]